MSKTRELAKAMRELADLYDELANVEENKELDEQQEEKELENLMGRILLKSLAIQKLQ